MSPKGRGNKETPYNVTKLLQDEVSRTSQAKTAKATKLTLQTVQRYIKGIGEPTTATLQKLADYFGVLVPWLQGHFGDMSYEAAKEHRKAAESGQRSGWIEGVEPVVNLQHRIQELLFRAVAITIGGGDQDYIKRVISEIEETLPLMDDGWKRVFADHLDRLKKMLPGKKSKK